MARLRREARAAARFKALAGAIRVLKSAAVYHRWKESLQASETAGQVSAETKRVLEGAARKSAELATLAADAVRLLPRLRDEAALAASLFGRLAIERDRLDRAVDDARQNLDRLARDLARNAEEREREVRALADARESLERLGPEIARLEAEAQAAPERLPALAKAHQTARADREAAESDLQALATEVATALAEARAAQARLDDAAQRLDRADAALRQIEAVGSSAPPIDLAGAEAEAARAEASLASASAAAVVAEATLDEARTAEEEARRAARRLADGLSALRAQVVGLRSPSSGEDPPTCVLESLKPKPGFEAALAAGLGDDAQASLDPASDIFWREGSTAPAPSWSGPVEALDRQVTASPALAARLAWIGLAPRDLGDSLQAGLPPGARLVSREGDLWRWDGLVRRAGAPTYAEVRLRQKARAEALSAEIAELAPRAETAARELSAAEADLAAARLLARERRELERTAAEAARRALAALAARRAEASRRDVELASLDAERRLRFAERERALAEHETARAAIPPAELNPERAEALERTRERAGRQRAAEVAAQAALDTERRLREGRGDRLRELQDEASRWAGRRDAAAARLAVLAAEEADLAASLATARDVPGQLELRRGVLLDEVAKAETRRGRAADLLQLAERDRDVADQGQRAAERAAADAREAVAGARERLVAAEARLAEQAAIVLAETGMNPEGLAAHLAEQAPVAPPDGRAADLRLAELEREREALGAINLRAEQDAADAEQRLAAMTWEREDLVQALKRLRLAIAELNGEGRAKLLAAFEVIDGYFRELFATLFEGGTAELRLVDAEDPLQAGLEIFACPPG
ncbi:MAG: chromosome segregation protein SMC, partial [Caulobacteraceae bacterium]|nr:chromosome segregation protein SMC [Caulobacteraceae bacterium]